MGNILLVEPEYRSKFPPLGLMKLATYHKEKGDTVTFVRGQDPDMRALPWDRVYVASLFTWELPKTVDTMKFYASAVSSPKSLYVGGVGVTLLPQYVRDRVDCTIVPGQIDRPNMLGRGSRAVAKLTPDYDILHAVEYAYRPQDTYFTRITKGCVRSCSFCAVPLLEPEFGILKHLGRQLDDVNRKYGAKQHLVIMDNNILGIDSIQNIIAGIANAGFQAGAKRNGRKRTVDFNQGLDARLISKNPKLAELLATVCLSPVRLGFDSITMEKSYRRAIVLLHEQGFHEFTNYMLFNFKDSPLDMYKRLMINADLNERLGIRITGFPMRFIPMDSIKRSHVSKKWNWRYLRGIQCILLATRGLISPNPDFVRAAFGRTHNKFLEILAMPDRYIIYREHYRTNGAQDWRRKFRRLSHTSKQELFTLLAELNGLRNKKSRIQAIRRSRGLIEHYYPGGEVPPSSLS